MIRHFTFLLLLLVPFALAAVDPETETQNYMLPQNSAFYDPIEAIFSRTDADLSPETINLLGFKIICKGNFITVGKHPAVPGAIFKFFKYNKFKEIDWQYWIHRVQGAFLIQEGIEKLGYQKIFSVPKKWLFKTHSKQLINDQEYPAYILVAEDMQLESAAENERLWAKKISKIELTALYHLLKNYGLRDSAKIVNVPYCKNGKLAFVDTETYRTWPIYYSHLLKSLSSKNKEIWKSLVKKGGDKLL